MKQFFLGLFVMMWIASASAQPMIPGVGSPMIPNATSGSGGGFPPSGCSTANGVIFNNATPCGSGFTFNPSGNILSLGGVPFLFRVTTNDVYGGGAGNTSNTGVESTGFGDLALNAVDTGGANSGFGTSALQVVTSGTENTGLGTHAAKLITTGNYNTVVGTDSLFSATTGSSNTCVGSHCMFGPNDTLAHATSNDTCVGANCLTNISSGSGNSLVGDSAGTALTTGSNNTGNGHSVLATEVTGSGNSVVGYDALITQNGASNNTALGFLSGFGVTTGQNNVLVGASPDAASYGQVTTGSNNVSIGFDVAVQTATASNQLVISNFIYGTGMSGTGASVSPGAVSFGTQSQISGYMVTVAGAIGSLQSISATSTDGVGLFNTTAATVGAQKWSPRLHWEGQGWGTTGSASQSVDWIEELQPLQGAAAPVGNMVWSYSVNGGAYTPLLTLIPNQGGVGAVFIGQTSGGTAYTGMQVSGVTDSIYCQGAVCAQVAATGFYQAFGYIKLANNTFLTSPTDANWQFGNANVNGAPVAQTLSFQGVITAMNQAGADATVVGSLATGNAANGKLILEVGKTGASGTTTATAYPMLTVLGLAATTSTIQFGDGTNFTTYDSCTALTTGATGVVACTASAIRFKELYQSSPLNIAGLDNLRTDIPWKYREDAGHGLDPTRIHVGLFADDVEQLDSRCVVYREGGLGDYEDRCVIAYLTAGYQRLRAEVEALRRSIAR